jgi:integrase
VEPDPEQEESGVGPPEPLEGVLEEDAGAIEVARPVAMAVPAALRANPVRVYLDSLQSANSRKTMADALRRCVRLMAIDPDGSDPDLFFRVPWWNLDAGKTTRIRGLLLEWADDDHSVGTVKLTLSALRGVLFQCFRLGYMDGDTFQRAVSWGKVAGGDEALAGRMLQPEEIERVRGACERQEPFEAALDVALLEVGLTAGARRHELARTRLSDLSDDVKQLRILGKRRKVRHLALPPHTGAVLEGWLAQRARFPFPHDALFVLVRRSKAFQKPMTPWDVWDRFRRMSAASGVSFTPHDLRRTYISVGLERSKGDISTVQQLAGHADPRTTARYDRRPEQTRDRVAMAIGAALAPKK